jgi:hypothetical protein
MSYNPYDAMMDEAMDAFAEETLREASLSPVRSYLGTYGDAIEQRVKQNVDSANALLQSGFPSPALVQAATAIEITIRFLLVRPLVQGAFLSDEWAEILAARIGTGRTAQDRELLPKLLRVWKIDVGAVTLSDGKPLWSTITDNVLKQRDRVVHQGETVSADIVNTTLECSKLLIDNIVRKIAAELGFTLERTGKWAEIHDIHVHPNGGKTERWQSFTPDSPFQKRHIEQNTTRQ